MIIFFLNDMATTEIYTCWYTLALHDAVPIGQISLVVAIAFVVGKAINFTLLLRERERQRLTVATAPAVARIIDAIERRSGNPAHSFGGGPAQERLAFTDRKIGRAHV